MPKQAKQTITGKAFEYALLNAFLERLQTITNVSVIDNEPLKTAKKCFDTFNNTDKGLYNLNASFAVNFLIDLEPRLSNGINKSDVLQFEIVSDKQGQIGDVRDVLAIRSLQKWEIGISAKNNHRAVKHSRLSNDINFGEKWLGVSCSENYFSEIKPIFDELAKLLSANFDVYSIEYKGHGKNNQEISSLSIELLSEEVLQFVHANRLQSCSIFGYSMGGYIALYATSTGLIHPKNIVTLGTKFDWTPQFAEKEVTMLDPGLLKEKAPAFLNSLILLHGNGVERILNSTKKIILDLGASPLLSESLLKNIDCKVFIGRGENDKMVTEDESAGILNQIRGSVYHVFANTPHPIDRVDANYVLNTFLGMLSE